MRGNEKASCEREKSCRNDTGLTTGAMRGETGDRDPSRRNMSEEGDLAGERNGSDRSEEEEEEVER